MNFNLNHADLIKLNTFVTKGGCYGFHSRFELLFGLTTDLDYLVLSSTKSGWLELTNLDGAHVAMFENFCGAQNFLANEHYQQIELRTTL